MHYDKNDYTIQLSVEQQLYDEVQRLTGELSRLERKYKKLQMKYQDRRWIIAKQSRRIQKLSGRKDAYVNEPVNKRRKGKKR